MADSSSATDDVTPLLREAEQKGLRIAIIARVAALITLCVFFLVSRGAFNFSRDDDNANVIGYTIAIITYLILGGCHYLLIGSRRDRPWAKYVFVAIDIALLSALIATQPIIAGLDLPQTFSFRNATFPLYFVILAIAAFSLSPWLTFFSGVAGGGGWLGAHHWAIWDMPDAFTWAEMPVNPDSQAFIAFFLDPNFVETGTRTQEATLLIVVATLVAVVIHRARQTVIRQLKLDEEKRTLSEVFGRYVPPAIAEALIDDKGMLEPVEREATILFLDIAGFTDLTEKAGPRGIVTILNNYFDDVARIISDHGGVITQFQGDAVLATFNLPLAHDDHPDRAVRAAQEIQTVTAKDHDLGIRIGICTGNVVAGNIGGGGRQTYTVHGATVNLAARLEGLNKQYGTEILVSRSTVDRLNGADPAKPNSNGSEFKVVGNTQVRGFSEKVEILTPAT